MYNYKMVLCYDGTKYLGWQRLGSNEERTIQGKLENVLSKLFDEPIQVIGSGRTDAGVHAKAQTANFHASSLKENHIILTYMAKYLPKDIAVLSLEQVNERFHARYNCTSKIYSYTIDTGLFADPFSLRYAYSISQAIDIPSMGQAAEFLVGTHDFKSFTSLKSKKKETIRTIHFIKIEEEKNLIKIYYKGDGFLQHMVRILTGTLLEVGMGKYSPHDMVSILESKTRAKAGPLVPPHGLCLEKVYY